jgi:uncharacterized YigZ family protein
MEPIPPDSYLTVATSAETELKVKRSRFVALAFPCESAAEAQQRLAATERRFHDARHVCYAYKLGQGQEAVARRSDAGEPSGTAGEPLLAAIEGRALTQVLLVVVRYFGGIKLGTGGLARAYGRAGALALDQAGTRRVAQGREFHLRFPYPQEKSLRKLLADHEGRLVDSSYQQDVSWRIWLPHSACRPFALAMVDLTAGASEMKEADE